jgi:hypothetical protein
VSAVWIALGAVPISLASVFIALNAAQAKKQRESGDGGTADAGIAHMSDRASDGGECGGDGGGGGD